MINEINTEAFGNVASPYKEQAVVIETLFQRFKAITDSNTEDKKAIEKANYDKAMDEFFIEDIR